MCTEMQKNNSCKVRIHIGFGEVMDLRSLEDAICLVNESVTDFYRETKRYDLVESSPRVLSVGNGSIITDVLLPVGAIVAPILYDIIKSAFAKRNNKYTVEITVFPERFSWTDEDNLAVCVAVLKEYVLRKSKKPYLKFAASLHLSKPYPDSSIKNKIENTKQLL
ncbi:MAG: hypothetical protein IKP74_02915, partial [Clostridia bacterium]|nr:hypothetical protein [Clostridia bacterium]